MCCHIACRKYDLVRVGSLVKELERQLQLLQAAPRQPVVEDTGGDDLAAALQGAFRRESAVLQEIQHMTQGLSAYGF